MNKENWEKFGIKFDSATEKWLSTYKPKVKNNMEEVIGCCLCDGKALLFKDRLGYFYQCDVCGTEFTTTETDVYIRKRDKTNIGTKVLIILAIASVVGTILAIIYNLK